MQHGPSRGLCGPGCPLWQSAQCAWSDCPSVALPVPPHLTPASTCGEGLWRMETPGTSLAGEGSENAVGIEGGGEKGIAGVCRNRGIHTAPVQLVAFFFN